MATAPEFEDSVDAYKSIAVSEYKDYVIEVVTAWDINTDEFPVLVFVIGKDNAKVRVAEPGKRLPTKQAALEWGIRTGMTAIDSAAA